MAANGSLLKYQFENNAPTSPFLETQRTNFSSKLAWVLFGVNVGLRRGYTGKMTNCKYTHAFAKSAYLILNIYDRKKLHIFNES